MLKLLKNPLVIVALIGAAATLGSSYFNRPDKAPTANPSPQQTGDATTSGDKSPATVGGTNNKIDIK